MPIRRYAPALIVAAALLLLVIVAPSRGASNSALPSYPAFTSGSGATPGAAAAPTATTGTGGSTSKAGSTGGGTTSSGGGANGTSTTSGGKQSSGSNGNSSGTAGGSTKHCVGGLQFSVAGFVGAPPCQPTFTGNNGGATFKGVTAKQIEVVLYQPKPSLALNAILGPAGLAPSPAQINDFLARETSFINARYELYGRKIHIDDYISPSCQASPPSDACFRQDAQAVVSKYHPFAVVYPRNLTAPGLNQELSHLGVVNFGAQGMPDSFDTSQQPYHYDYDMDGDTQSELAGEFYCKELANRKAIFAGSAALRNKPRTAEILVDDTPEHVEAAQHLQSIIDSCDHGGGAIIRSFSPDTSEAVVSSTTLASQAKQNGITTMLYYTDPILPVFLTPQLTAQNYFPENVVIGSGYLDFDGLAQLYDKKQWANAFGIGDLPDMAPPAKYDSGAMYRVTKGKLPIFASSDNYQGFFTVLAAGLQQAGATLNPGTFERGVLTLPAWGGTRYHSLINFGAGDYTGVADARLIYWSNSRTSPANGKKGTYVSLNNGERYGLGHMPDRTFAIPGRG